MTAHFAIPATTFVLREIVQRELRRAYGALTAPTMSVEPPPRPAASASPPAPGPTTEAPGLHLFLHHVGPNAAWRNLYEPHLNSAGVRVGPSPIAVDLHYMVAASGGTLEREVLLGVGIAALNAHGIVPRAEIQSILGSIAVPNNPTSILDTLTQEPLGTEASQPQQITVSLAPVDVDLSTKIWSALQSPMRPSFQFLATTIFLDLAEPFAARPEAVTANVGVTPHSTLAAPTTPDGISFSGAAP